LPAPLTTWDTALPLGNGILGGLLWGGDSTLNLSLDRADLWDLRPAAPFGTPGYRYADIIRLVREAKADSLRDRFDDPYDNIPYPTKLPGGRVVFALGAQTTVSAFSLNVGTAEATAQTSGGEMTGIFSAIDTVALFHVPNLSRVTIVRPPSLARLGYDDASFRDDSARTGVHEQWMIQRAAGNLTYVVAVGSRSVGTSSLVAITIATSGDGTDPVRIARSRLERALRAGFEPARRAHRAWWSRFWSTSASISVPDSALQAHLRFVQYLYGAGARTGAPPIPLQGVWTADGGSLPPWKGDLHNDLNTQMTYLAAHASGADDALRGWLEFNWRLLPTYRRFAREFFGVRGAAIPGVMALDGMPLGGWGQYSLSPTMGLWVAQSFHLHWRYSRDTRFLRERAYPFVAELGRATLALLVRGEDGTLRLPLSTSPEIFDNSMKAWLPSMSNFDLALLHWTFGALDEMATALGRMHEAAQWRLSGAALPAMVIDSANGTLPFAKGLPYAESHRHFSHAMAIHPLALLTIDDPKDSIVVERSLDELKRFGSDWWTGYSFAWYSAMLARAGRGEEALAALETYQRAFILPNGFHANGDQTKSGLSRYTYRPVTLEGNFLALHAAQEMLLQSWGGVVRVFPAVSDRWRDASFRRLRAEGGFRVSAVRRGGATRLVRITSTVRGVLRLRDPFDGARVTWNRPAVRRMGNDYIVRLSRGETLAAHR
jgi:alpha-L-fucosidase 2